MESRCSPYPSENSKGVSWYTSTVTTKMMMIICMTLLHGVLLRVLLICETCSFPPIKSGTEELFVCHCKGLWLWEAHNHRKEPWRKNGSIKIHSKITDRERNVCPLAHFEVHTLQAPRLHFHPDMRLRESRIPWHSLFWADFLANCNSSLRIPLTQQPKYLVWWYHLQGESWNAPNPAGQYSSTREKNTG